MTDHELLLEIAARLARVEALLDPDTARLNVLIPKIAAECGTLSFLVGDLDGTVDFNGLSAPKIGKLLERHVGEVFCGYRIEMLGITREGREWCLTLVGSAPEQAASCVALTLKTRKGTG